MFNIYNTNQGLVQGTWLATTTSVGTLEPGTGIAWKNSKQVFHLGAAQDCIEHLTIKTKITLVARMIHGFTVILG